MKNSVIIVAVFALFSCGNSKEVKPIREDIEELVFASGQLEWDDAYNLTAQTDGVVQNADFEVGTLVTKDKIIANIDNAANKVNTQTAQKQLAIANDNLSGNSIALQQLNQNIQVAESKYQQDKMQEQRYLKLFESQSVAKIEYENMQLNTNNSLANLNVLKTQAAQIMQQAQQAQINNKGQFEVNQMIQNYNNIVVIESGTIIKKYKNTGDYIRKGEILASVANAQKVEAVINVDESSISKVKIGQPVFVKLNTNKTETLQGKVTEILSAFDQQTQSFICKVTFDKTIENSLYGTQLEANILVGSKKNALLIPRKYVGFGSKVKQKGKDQNTIIKTGIVSTEYVEVLSGIDENAVLLPFQP